jgi:GDP-L-fucose synthase
VGSAIIRKLTGDGYPVILSSWHDRRPDAGAPSTVTWLRCDLTRQGEVESLFEAERPEYVFLAAARVGGILANNTYRADFIYQNLAIATNVIYAAYRFGARKLLNLGSSCIYPRNALQPMREEYLLTGGLEPTNEPYAIAKIAAIKLCRYFNEQYGTDFISIMPTNLYGPGDNFDLESSHVLPALVRKFSLAKLLRAGRYEDIKRDFMRFGNRVTMVNGRAVSIDGDSREEDILAALEHYGIRRGGTAPAETTVTLWGTGSPYREFLHVDDCAGAAVLLMDKYSHADTGELINVGTGGDICIRDLAELVKRAAGFGGEVRFDGAMPDGMSRKLLDVMKMKALGWVPRVTLGRGVELMLEWYEGQRRAVSPPAMKPDGGGAT